MNSKPNRTEWEAPNKDAKVKYLKRKQEEQESKRSLEDFLRHLRDEEDSHSSPD